MLFPVGYYPDLDIFQSMFDYGMGSIENSDIIEVCVLVCILDRIILIMQIYFHAAIPIPVPKPIITSL